MTRVRSPGGWVDGSTVDGDELEALDQGQHTAIKYGAGATYDITGNPITFTGKGLRVAGEGLKLDSADGIAYSGGMGGAPLKREFILNPAWFTTVLPFTAWEFYTLNALQKTNTNAQIGHVLDLSRWHKQKLRRIRLRAKGYGSGHTDMQIGTMTKPKFAVVKMKVTSDIIEEIVGFDQMPWTYYSDASTTAAEYESPHWIDSGADALNIDINCNEYRYAIFAEGEHGPGSLSVPQFTIWAVAATIDILTMPFG